MQSFQEWSTDEVQKVIEEGNHVVLIDVREPEEYAAGHIPGIKLIPMHEIPQHIDDFDNDTTYVMVCRSGVRSHHVCEYLAAHGKQVVNMIGGMLQWEGEVER